MWCMRWVQCTHYPSGGLHAVVVIDVVEDVVVAVLTFVIGHEVLGALNGLGGAAGVGSVVAVQIEVRHVDDEAVAHSEVEQPWSELAGKPHCTVPLF